MNGILTPDWMRQLGGGGGALGIDTSHHQRSLETSMTVLTFRFTCGTSDGCRGQSAIRILWCSMDRREK